MITMGRLRGIGLALAAALVVSACGGSGSGSGGSGSAGNAGGAPATAARKVIGVTLSPFGRYAYWSPAIEAERDAINRWIRTSHAFDGIIDFDRVLRDPTHPAWLNPRYDSGDGLHPNDAGHAAMARAIPLSLFPDGAA